MSRFFVLRGQQKAERGADGDFRASDELYHQRRGGTWACEDRRRIGAVCKPYAEGYRAVSLDDNKIQGIKTENRNGTRRKMLCSVSQ